jgi:hypothetical protein
MISARYFTPLLTSTLLILSSANMSAEEQSIYTKLDSQGKTLPSDAKEWRCVKDNATNLIWEVKTSDDGLQGKNNRYSWESTSENQANPKDAKPSCTILNTCDVAHYAKAVSASKLCGLNNWRLPDIHELNSIVKPMKRNSIDMNYFPNTQGSIYLSSSEAFDNDMLVHGVDFDMSYADVFYKGGTYHVRLVQPAQ